MPKVKEPEVGAMTTTNWVNIIILGAGFMLLFTAFQTTAFVQVRGARKVLGCRVGSRGGAKGVKPPLPNALHIF